MRLQFEWQSSYLSESLSQWRAAGNMSLKSFCSNSREARSLCYREGTANCSEEAGVFLSVSSGFPCYYNNILTKSQ